MNFYDTVAGKRFFEGQLPKLISALQEIARGLHQVPGVVSLPVDTPDILHDLFFGQYEPYFDGPNTEEYQKVSRELCVYLEKLREELPREYFIKAERLLAFSEERASAEREQAFCAGYRCAVQLLLCGLRGPERTAKEEIKNERENI